MGELLLATDGFAGGVVGVVDAKKSVVFVVAVVGNLDMVLGITGGVGDFGRLSGRKDEEFVDVVVVGLLEVIGEVMAPNKEDVAGARVGVDVDVDVDADGALAFFAFDFWPPSCCCKASILKKLPDPKDAAEGVCGNRSEYIGEELVTIWIKQS